ncbi:putative O-methyltransferase [Viridothelium virens]|uniref:Putative O-methyltransferase n=1 Tax=Viridothelium virens TaxID=1048519 RepID=A0A6A6GZQ0_VIRVR|nr:putative O-methyltransferase [Viridothelium virens]
MTWPFSTTEEVIDQLQITAKAYADKRPGAREQLLNLSQTLTASLELPSEAIQRVGWAEPARTAHCRLAVELGLFEQLKASGEGGIGAQELSTKVGADEVLIARVLRHLAATYIIREKGPDCFSPTYLSNAFTEPKFRAGIIYTFDVAGPSFHLLPNYLKSISYGNPTELTDGPFQYAHKTQLPFFAWLDQNPPYLSVFNDYMSAYRAGKLNWVDPGFYPVSERLIRGFNSTFSDVFLVDVGGGLGHDLRELETKISDLPGRLILQDREEVISTLPSATADNKFEAKPHDFFTSQPVQGARAYYLHSVLHDWSDVDCIRILEQLRPAMKKGYSKLLVNEIVVPKQGGTWPVTAMDQLMLVLGAMKERTEMQWNDILEKAGFKVTGIWSLEMGTESLIEAEVA